MASATCTACDSDARKLVGVAFQTRREIVAPVAILEVRFVTAAIGRFQSRTVARVRAECQSSRRKGSRPHGSRRSLNSTLA
jgi:hypothetical protein